MGFFSKKEVVPEIPPALSVPELPKQEVKGGLPELPSFPSSSKTESMNQNIVKSAVMDMPPEEINMDALNIREEPLPNTMIPSKPIDVGVIPSAPKIPSIANIHEKPRTIGSTNTASKQHEPIFVRIDKFQSAQKNLEGIKEKVAEIESVLGKIKDVRSSEEVELKGWMEDIEKIKARLAEIDSDVFGQI